MGKSKLWGGILAIASIPVAVSGGLVKGAYDAASGNGSFKEGYNEVVNNVVDGAVSIGEEHGDKLNTVATWVAGGIAAKAGGDIYQQIVHPNNNTPPKTS